MTRLEVEAIREGDVLYDIERNKGYHITKKENGWLEYEDNIGRGTIPIAKLLRWNFVSLMRDRELTWEDMEKIHHITNFIDKQHCDNMIDFYSRVLREYSKARNK